MFGKKKRDGVVLGATLIDGLPLNQGQNMVAKLTADKLLLIATNRSGNKEFEIDFSKITGIEYKSETEINNIIKQSGPGMIIGAAAFGILGALVGGRVKTKQVKTTTHFIIINYTSGQIVLESNDGVSSVKIAEYYRQLNPLPDKTVL